jgi:hypothetical protein
MLMIPFKHLFFSVILLSNFIYSWMPIQSTNSQQTGGMDEPFAGDSLCIPAAYPSNQDECLAKGPSAFLSELARNGVEYPFIPLAAINPDPTFRTAPDAYIKVGKQSFPVYPTLADASARNHVRYLDAGTKYLAFLSRVDQEDGIYYQTKSGMWIEAGEADAACCIYEGRFQGMQFNHTPVNSFGWIVDQARPRVAPSYQAVENGKVLQRETVVQIYNVIEGQGTNWYMIGLNDWVERRFIRQLVIRPTPPQGVTRDRWIEINLYEQTLSVYEKGKLVFATLIASGVEPFFTRPGVFQIYKKKPVETMSGAFEANRSDFYYFENVPWTMYFDEERAIHGAYWRTLFGYEQSHGCVNLSIGDSRLVYDWAKEGDWVYVWDPSGTTPTDPSFYTKGGA